MLWTKESLKNKRVQLGFSQSKLGELLGVHWRTIQNWENGVSSIPSSCVPALEKVLCSENETIPVEEYNRIKAELKDAQKLNERLTKIINHTSKSRGEGYMKIERPKIISIFSGAGGLDIGFEAAGFETAVAVELDSSCCETLKSNRPNISVINKDITEVSGEEILSAAKLKVGEPALVIGGPPCQSFSLAGLRKGLEDDRGKLLFEFVRIVRETLPKGFVLENVKGLANWDNGRAVELLLKELSQPIEYNGVKYQYSIAKPQVLNAVDFDVPQFRERLILVGNRIGKSFLYPTPELFVPQKTVWDAIGSLPAPEAPSEAALRVSNTIKGRREKYGY